MKDDGPKGWGDPGNRFATLPKQGMTAQEFLCWSMDRHAEVKTFEARASVKGLNIQQRHIQIERPNRYRIHSSTPGRAERDSSNQPSRTETVGYPRFEMTSICDGEKTIEYSSREDQQPMLYPAPDSVATATSMFMMHPMFCGSLLYRFFAESQDLEKLAWLEKGSIEYGDSEKVAGGEIATAVKFYGRENYGNVLALIGLKTGLVHRLAYDSAELYKFMREPSMRKAVRSATRHGSPWKGALASFSIWVCTSTFAKPRWTIHSFEDIVLNQPISESEFDTSPPDDREPMDVTDKGKPPVPIGEPAPDFEVKSLDGKVLRLSDLRGQVVFIDLWATWCGPCRIGLPDTMALAEEGLEQGFHVLAVSNEERKVIAEFVRKEGLVLLPAYSDTSGEVWSKYKVQGIPTTIVVDAAGNLADYMVGLRPKEELLAAIKAAQAL